MSSQPLAPATKKSWFLSFFILCGSVLIYGILCYLMTHISTLKPSVSPVLLKLRTLYVATAVTFLVTSVAWLRLHIDGKIGNEGRETTLSPAEFQTHSIVALALSNACSVMGLQLFFVGAPISEFAVFAFGTLFVNFAFILPRGLQFWSTEK